MSTFDGNVVEIPEISLDRFDGKNLESIAYFLSHFHWDHTHGLNNWQFLQRLRNNQDIFLYASDITVVILQHKFPGFSDKFRSLPIQSPTLIPLSNRYISVTLIPAGHCPGSVMFLFENEHTILCTGDYNITCSDLKKFKCFYTADQVKHIDTLYLDTTFLNESYSYFPPRKESLSQICKEIKKWIDQSPDHRVKIDLSARYGSEYLFIEIFKRLQMPIHVTRNTYELYNFIPEMDGAITFNEAMTQIHSSCGTSYNALCKQFDQLKIIKPCAMSFRNYTTGQEIVSVCNGIYKICYATHAPYEEIKKFILFLKPDNIVPCVKDSGSKIENKIKEIMDLYKTDKESAVVSELTPPTTSLGLSKTNDNIKEEARENIDEDLSTLLDSPPRNFKRRRTDVCESEIV